MPRTLGVTLLFLCVNAYAQGPTMAAAENVVVTATGGDEGDSVTGCEGFTLSAAQARHFLNRAKIVTRREIHDYYAVGPCYVTGTASFNGYPASWTIRVGGTGSISLMSGEHLPIVDEAERDGLDD